MSDRAISRHRAPQRAVTPLSEISDVVTGQFAVVGRTTAIAAMSTGLVASIGLPAQAVTNWAAPAAVTSLDTSATTAFASTPAGLDAGFLLTGSPDLARGGAVSAPMSATVSFETGAFTAVPKQAATKPTRVAQMATKPSGSSPSARDSSTPAVAPTGSVGGSSVLAIAARYVGTPYLYGGTTPNGFDCSGFTGYVYRQLGIALPRTANEQMMATSRISRSRARPGDLVFFVSGGRAYHNGIYAGNGMMYDSPRTGKTVQKRAIWDATVVFTRVTS